MAKNQRASLHLEAKRVTSTAMYRYALEYYAAGMLVDDTLGDDDEFIFFAPTPVHFLIARSMELSLKSFLIQSGNQLSDLLKISHNLSEAVIQADREGLEKYVQLSVEDRSLIDIINELYWNKEFEYPVTGAKTVPIFGHMHPIAEKLLLGISEFVPHAKQFLARKKAGQILQKYSGPVNPNG